MQVYFLSCMFRVVKDPNTQRISIASTVLKVQAKVSINMYNQSTD